MANESLTPDRRVVRPTSGDSGFVTRRVAGETIIVPVSSRVGDLDAIYTLNEAGSRIWSLVESSTAIQDIVTALCDEYEAPRDQIRKDVDDLLQELQSNGLIHIGAGTEA
jgi:hypothetical protein